MKIILFALLEQWADFEMAYLSIAINMLSQGQYCIKTVSLTKDEINSIGGLHFSTDYDVESAPEEYEALILIGGNCWRNENAVGIKPLVDDCLKKGKILGGICDASGFLGTIGVLNNVKHTSNDINDLKNWAKQSYTGEKNYIMKQAVRDKNIITANGTAALEFAKEVMLALQVSSDERIYEWYNFHKLGFYTAATPQM